MAGGAEPNPYGDGARPTHAIESELARATDAQWREIDLIMGGNVSLSKEIVILLKSEVPRLWQELDSAITSHQAREARRAAHTLKSNLRNVALTITEICLANVSHGRSKSSGLKSSYSAQPCSPPGQLQEWCEKMLQLR